MNTLKTLIYHGMKRKYHMQKKLDVWWKKASLKFHKDFKKGHLRILEVSLNISNLKIRRRSSQHCPVALEVFTLSNKCDITEYLLFIQTVKAPETCITSFFIKELAALISWTAIWSHVVSDYLRRWKESNQKY